MSRIQNINKDSSINIPTPLISLGNNKFLQNIREIGIIEYMTWDNHVPGTINEVLANDNIKIGVSYKTDDKDYTKFIDNKPMIFLFLMTNKSKRKRNNSTSTGDNYNKTYVHPTHNIGPLNREKTYFGGNISSGGINNLETEWDFSTHVYHKLSNKTEIYNLTDQIIEINPHQLYKDPSITLPLPLVEFKRRAGKYSLREVSPGGYGGEVTSMKQPMFFKFACIDPNDPKKVLFGEPSKVVYIAPKIGTFGSNLPYGSTPNINEQYLYDWEVQFGY